MKNTRKILIITLALLLILSSITLFACKDKKTTVVNSQNDLIGTWQADNNSTWYIIFDQETFNDDGVVCYYYYNKNNKTITYSFTKDGPIESDYYEIKEDDKGNTYLQNTIESAKFYKVKD